MPKDRSSPLKSAALISVGSLIFLAMVLRIGLGRMGGILQGVDPYYLAVVFVIIFLVIVVKGLRWVLLYRAIRPGGAMNVYVLGQCINEVAPIGTGELARCYVARDGYGVPFGKTLAPAAIERLADTTLLVGGAVIFCLAVLPNLLFEGELGAYYLALVIPITILALAYFLMARLHIIGRWGDGLKKRAQERDGLLARGMDAVGSLFLSFTSAFATFGRRRGALYQAAGLTVVAWGLEALGQTMIFVSIGYVVSPLYLWGVICTAWVVGTFAFVPGGVGVRDVVYAFLAGLALGGDLAVGLSVAVLYRLVAYTLLGSWGAVAAAGVRRGKKAGASGQLL